MIEKFFNKDIKDNFIRDWNSLVWKGNIRHQDVVASILEQFKSYQGSGRYQRQIAIYFWYRVL